MRLWFVSLLSAGLGCLELIKENVCAFVLLYMSVLLLDASNKSKYERMM
jgi:hypothetical protein